MGKFILYAILTIVGGTIIFFIHGDSTAKDYGVHLIAVASIFGLEAIIENRRHLWLLFLSKVRYRNKFIRLSIASLYQIKVNGVYLLVKGNRINQYQPVGGVFKRFRESFYQLQNLEVLDDSNIPIDHLSINDLRIKLPGRHLIEFLEWYYSQLGREISPNREFHEELIRTGVLLHKDFPYANYLYLNRKQTPIHYSKHFQCYEIIIAEIFKLMPSENQENILKDLTTQQSDYFMWVDEDTIRRRGANIGVTISETSEWIL